MGSAGAETLIKPTKQVRTSAVATPRSRAMYVWAEDRAVASTVAQFVKAKQVSEIHLSEPQNTISPAEKTWIQSFRTKAPGVKILALADPGVNHCAWLAPGNEKSAANWVSSMAATKLFDGYNLDLEPWKCPGWDANRAARTVTYKNVLTNAYANKVGKPLYATIGGWMEKQVDSSDGTLLNAVLKRTDGVVVMCYMDNIKTITDCSSAELTAARSSNKYIRVALTTDAVGFAGLTAPETFGDTTAKTLDAALNSLDQQPCTGSCTTDSYAGPMVNAYYTWKKLR